MYYFWRNYHPFSDKRKMPQLPFRLKTVDSDKQRLDSVPTLTWSILFNKVDLLPPKWTRQFKCTSKQTLPIVLVLHPFMHSCCSAWYELNHDALSDSRCRKVICFSYQYTHVHDEFCFPNVDFCGRFVLQLNEISIEKVEMKN